MSPYPWRTLLALEHTLQEQVAAWFGRAGFHVETAGDPEEAIRVVRDRPFDLIFLQFLPPNPGGLQLCRRIRALAPGVGIVVLRGGGGPENDILALDAGADDCIRTPLRFREIVARVGAVLKSKRMPPLPEAELMQAGDIQLDVSGRRLWKAGQEVRLSAREFDLLFLLMKNREVPLTYARLYRWAWKEDTRCDRGSLRTCIGFLRGKIEDDLAHPVYILNEPWIGYRFHDPGGAPFPTQL